jgi:Tfp pilus assembly protein FimT
MVGCCKKNNYGFSLVELAMLVGVTAMLTALSVPMLNNSMKEMKLITEAKSISTTLTYAKINAISQMNGYRVSVTLGTNNWQLDKYDKTNNNYDIQEASHTLSNEAANTGITFKANSASGPSGFPTTSSTAITFNSQGIPREGQSIIYISNGDHDFAVTVSLSGKVQFWTHQNSQWRSNK